MRPDWAWFSQQVVKARKTGRGAVRAPDRRGQGERSLGLPGRLPAARAFTACVLRASVQDEGAQEFEPRSKAASFAKELQFFERVKQRLRNRDVYQEFLKCLNIFNQDIITKMELRGLVYDVLGKYPDLLSVRAAALLALPALPLAALPAACLKRRRRALTTSWRAARAWTWMSPRYGLPQQCVAVFLAVVSRFDGALGA